MDLQAIRKIAYEILGSKKSHPWKEAGNKYYHGERVANLVITLRKHIFPDDHSHDDILAAAALFHDILNGSERHAEEGSKTVREILSGYCTEYELGEICGIISVHDDRTSDYGNYSEYIKLHQDADHLDHFGTFDVWLEIIYSVNHDQSILDAVDWFKNIRMKESVKYRSELNYDISKKIFDEKDRFVSYFGQRLGVEGSGGIWNEEELLKDINKR
jgi:uncharacterized protein